MILVNLDEMDGKDRKVNLVIRHYSISLVKRETQEKEDQGDLLAHLETNVSKSPKTRVTRCHSCIHTKSLSDLLQIIFKEQ